MSALPPPSRLTFGSVCSGIEACSVAWAPLGWTPAFVSEIEAFPRAVLKHRHPEAPLHGDFTTIEAGQYAPIDLLVGGTPCQSFSVAGLRGGLSDARGNLALEFLRLADRLRPRWVVWENVPGVFSATSHDAPDPREPTSDVDGCPLDAGDFADGAEFVETDEYEADEDHALACFLAGLSELGYWWAYRVLDAQYAGVPQRRRRIFVVGYLGDWRPPAAVLLERESLSGDPPPRRGAGEGAAGTLAGGARRGGGYSYDGAPLTACGPDADEALANAPLSGLRGDLPGSLRHGPPHVGSGGMSVMRGGDSPGSRPVAFGGNNTAGAIDVATAVTAVTAHGGPHGRLDFESETFVAHAFDAEQRDVIQYGDLTGPLDTDGYSQAVAFALRGRDGGALPEVEGDGSRAGALRAASGGSSRDYVAFNTTQITSKANYSNSQPGDPCHPLATTADAPAIADVRAFTCSDQANSFAWESDAYPTLTAQVPNDTSNIQYGVRVDMAVRRLTPRECERLQGFTDDYTLIPWRGGMAPDGPRYKALGNSMAVPVMRWIGERIAQVDALVQAGAAAREAAE